MKKIDFVFVYEVKNRELDNMCLVAAYLRRKGYTVEFINSWESLYKRPPMYSAKVAVISACYNDATYDYFAGHVAKYKSVVNMQWEQILTNHFYEDHESEFRDICEVGLRTRHVCWGEKEKAWLHDKYHIDNDLLFVEGYIPIDFYRAENKELLIERKELFSKYHLDPAKKTLLFVSSLSSIGLPDTEEVGSDIYFAMKKENDSETQRIILEWFERLLKEQEDIQLVYRYHPVEMDNEKIEELERKYSNFFAISEEAIRNWIAACDKIYNWCSTSMIEMYCSKNDTYLLRPIPVPYDIDMPIFEHSESIQSYEEFEQSVLEPMMKSFPVSKDELLQWYDIQKEPAFKRVAMLLIRTLEDETYQSRPSKNNMHAHIIIKSIKRYITKTKLFQFVLKYLCKLNFDNIVVKRAKIIRNNIMEQAKYQSAKNEQNGYIRKKYVQNCASNIEIENKIRFYEKYVQ